MSEVSEAGVFPWQHNTKPLMLAPMQGLTNRAMRAAIINRSRPDTVFTEFVRVRPGAKKIITDVDRLEAASREGGIPLVVQLIGRDCEGLLAGARIAGECGAKHININMGCPFGRMHSGSAGGALLKNMAGVAATLQALRQEVQGTLSVKVRSGYDDPEQIFSLLPIFENVGIDFLVLHPRTVKQRYTGSADHQITERVVAATKLPVIANGDICSREDADRVLNQTGAVGLMMGRGVIDDPFLFARIRGEKPAVPERHERAAELGDFLRELCERYQEIFYGEEQILRKLKGVVSFITDQEFAGEMRTILRVKKLARFIALIRAL